MKKGKSRTGDAYGEGGIGAALGRNPNPEPTLNSSPEGPFAHEMGMEGDGGVQGSRSVKGKNGETFYFGGDANG